MGEALKYIVKYWDSLCLFLSDGHIELDNPANRIEQKNALFAGHEAGAKNWAMIVTLIEICKLNAIGPQIWMTSTLTAIVNGHKQGDIDKLLPWNYPRKV